MSVETAVPVEIINTRSGDYTDLVSLIRSTFGPFDRVYSNGYDCVIMEAQNGVEFLVGEGFVEFSIG